MKMFLGSAMSKFPMDTCGGHQNLAKGLLSAVDNLGHALNHLGANEAWSLDGILRRIELVEKNLGGITWFGPPRWLSPRHPSEKTAKWTVEYFTPLANTRP